MSARMLSLSDARRGGGPSAGRSPTAAISSSNEEVANTPLRWARMISSSPHPSSSSQNSRARWLPADGWMQPPSRQERLTANDDRIVTGPAERNSAASRGDIATSLYM